MTESPWYPDTGRLCLAWQNLPHDAGLTGNSGVRKTGENPARLAAIRQALAENKKRRRISVPPAGG